MCLYGFWHCATHFRALSLWETILRLSCNLWDRGTAWYHLELHFDTLGENTIVLSTWQDLGAQFVGTLGSVWASLKPIVIEGFFWRSPRPGASPSASSRPREFLFVLAVRSSGLVVRVVVFVCVCVFVRFFVFCILVVC